MFLDKNHKTKANVYKLKNSIENWNSNLNINIEKSFDYFKKQQSDFTQEIWVFTDNISQKLIKKIDSKGIPISKFLIIGKGMETGRNKVFSFKKQDLEKMELTLDSYFHRARNSDIQRYSFKNTDNLLIYIEKYNLFSNLPQNIQDHLSSKKVELKKRAAYKRGDCLWWKYTFPLHKEYLLKDKIYSPYMSKINRFALDENGQFLGLTDTTVLFENGQKEEMKYLLGLLNSNLLTFRYKYLGKLKSGGVLEYFWNQISKLPIIKIDFSNKPQKNKHDKIVSLVTQIMELKKKLTEANIPQVAKMLERQIESTDKQIDHLVYDLYGLNDSEIKIIEES